MLFVGCKEISKKVLAEGSQAEEGRRASIRSRSRRPAATLEEFYHKTRLQPAPESRCWRATSPKTAAPIFLINEGTKQRVCGSIFVGNTIADDGRLRTQIKTSHPFLWLFKGEFDRKQLDEDRRPADRLLPRAGFLPAPASERPRLQREGELGDGHFRHRRRAALQGPQRLGASAIRSSPTTNCWPI